jgi:hydrogenase expression/formation protein HypC
MCLGVPMKVCAVSDNTAEVELLSIKRDVDVRFLEGVKPGDYVIVHAGFAIQILDPDEALKTLELVREMGEGHP